MIIQCESCSRKFVVRNQDIPEAGRTVQCGYCSVTWHQMPILLTSTPRKEKNFEKVAEKIDENLSVEEIKASDGKTYKFLGSQWAELLPSGKTGLFARKKIGNELDKLTGRKSVGVTRKKKKKIKKEVDPSSESFDNEKQLPEIYKSKQGLGFFGYIFLVMVIGFCLVGILKTFETDLLINFPETKYIFQLLDEQLKYFSETFKNMIVLINDLINSY